MESHKGLFWDPLNFYLYEWPCKYMPIYNANILCRRFSLIPKWGGPADIEAKFNDELRQMAKWLKVNKLHQPRLRFITGGYLVKRWFITAAARARGQSNDLNREILASNLFNCHKEVINAPPVPLISRCIHIVYRHKNVWEYQWSNFIYNCMSTLLHYVHCKDALLDCSAPGGERCESLTWVDEIDTEQW